MKYRCTFPRTLNEAFGPYASGPVEPMDSKPTGYPLLWWVGVVTIAVLGAVIIAYTRTQL